MRRQVLGVLMVLGLLAAPASARQAGADNELGAVRDQLQNLNGTLAQIVSLMERLVQQQQTDTLLRRIEMKERRILPIESRLRGNREDLGELESRLVELQEEREKYESEARQRERDGEENALLYELEAMRMEQRRLQNLLEARHRAISELEVELGTLERQISILEEQLGEVEER